MRLIGSFLPTFEEFGVMKESLIHMRVLCAAAAVVLTALSSTVFQPDPTHLDRRVAPASSAMVANADHAPSTVG
jgi:hypothetical protein